MVDFSYFFWLESGATSTSVPLYPPADFQATNGTKVS